MIRLPKMDLIVQMHITYMREEKSREIKNGVFNMKRLLENSRKIQMYSGKSYYEYINSLIVALHNQI